MVLIIIITAMQRPHLRSEKRPLQQRNGCWLRLRRVGVSNLDLQGERSVRDPRKM